jgi:hypothetical protein
MTCVAAIGAGLEKCFEFRLPNVWAFLTAVLVNQQTSPRSQTVGRVHYDLSNDFFRSNARSTSPTNFLPVLSAR